MSKGTPIITMRLQSELKHALDAICKAEGITLSDAIRQAIVAWLAHKSGSETTKQPPR